MRVETRPVKHRGIRWIVSDERRVLAKGWFKDGKLRADFGEFTVAVRDALEGAGVQGVFYETEAEFRAALKREVAEATQEEE